MNYSAELQSLFNSFEPHIALLDADGTIIATNAAWETFAVDNDGTPETCGIGTNYLAVCRADSGIPMGHAAADGIAAVLKGERPTFALEYPCHIAALERWYLMDVRQFSTAAAGCVVVHTDITPARTHEGSLLGQQDRFRSLIQHAGELISIMTPLGVISYQSPALESVMGYAAGELDGRDGLPLLHPDDQARALEDLQALAQIPGASARSELRMRHGDGSWRWLDTVATNLIHDPNVRGFVINSRDITDRKATLARLEDQERTLSLALEAGGMAVWDWDVATDRMIWSGIQHLDTPEAWSGWHAGAFSPDSAISFSAVHPDDQATSRIAFDAAEASGWNTFESLYRVLTADGGSRWLYDRGIGVGHDGSARAQRMVGVTRDVTAPKMIQQSLAERAESFSTLFEATAEAMAIHDGAVLVGVNAAYAALVGSHEIDLIGRPIFEMVAPEWVDLARQHATDGIEAPYEIMARHADGSIFPVELLGRPIRYEGRSLRLLTVRDIRVRRKEEEVLRESEARFRALVQEASDIVVVFDADGGLQYANPALLRVLGHPIDSYRKGLRLDLVHPDDRIEVAETWSWLKERAGNRKRLVYRTFSIDGNWVWLEGIFTNLLHDTAVHGIVLNVRDVSEQKRLEAELRHLSLHDPLTGLANRSLLSDRLDAALRRNNGVTGHVGILFIDLDHFKHVNDGFGHAAGDALLREVAIRLAAILPLSETIARIGGDEFVVLLPNIGSEEEAQTIADRLLRTMSMPLTWQGEQIHVGLSIGVAINEPGQSAADVLLRAGDAALYRAKIAGRGRSIVHRPEMTARATRRRNLEVDLREAASRNEFTLVYQPIVDLTTQLVVFVEALLRWHHPRYGPVFPDEFIPLAEETGSIVPIGWWIVDEVCRQIVLWGEAAPVIAINLSAAQFADRELVATMNERLRHNGVPPHRVRVEITEHSLLLDLRMASATLDQFRALGITTAIDDFGTGYSSLRYLRTLRVDAIKLDRSWVHDLDLDPEALAFIAGVIALAHSVGLKVTAEGIESAEQLRLLCETGCDHGQGYLLARPTPAGSHPPGVSLFPNVNEALNARH